jgi:hypothetical protein
MSVADIMDSVEVVNPYFDLVQPDLLSLFVTNEYVFANFTFYTFSASNIFFQMCRGSYAPSYVSRLLTETYHSEDFIL